MFTNYSTAVAHFSSVQQTPAQPGWHWGIRKIAGMQMWWVGQFWNAA
jgi:hypothetical protein